MKGKKCIYLISVAFSLIITFYKKYFSPKSILDFFSIIARPHVGQLTCWLSKQLSFQFHAGVMTLPIETDAHYWMCVMKSGKLHQTFLFSMIHIVYKDKH